MRRQLSIRLLVAVGLLLPVTLYAEAQGILNPDFERNTHWTFSDNGAYWTGGYSTEWASSGARSYEIHIPPAATGCDNYPGKDTHAEVSQSVDFSAVDALQFDLKTFGTWDLPALGSEYYHSVEVTVDGVTVYHMERETGEFHDQSVPCSSFTGVHVLSFLMQGHASFCSSSDRGMYIDNIRVVRRSFFSYVPFIARNSSALHNAQ